MLYSFLTDYLTIIIFLFMALGLSIGFIAINFLAAPNNPDPENFQLMNADSRHLTTQEWNSM